MLAAAPLLRVENLTAQFAPRVGLPRGCVQGVRFTVEAGGTLGIVGEAGAGKSLLALALSGGGARADGLLVAGRVLLDGRPAQDCALDRRRIRTVFQKPLRGFVADATVGQQMIAALHTGAWPSRAAARKCFSRALDALRTPGTPSAPNWLDCYPYQLPRDLCRRAALAMALCAQPDVLIADEPGAALDAPMLDWLREHQTRRAMSLILLTRDAHQAAKMCDEVAVLCAGRIVEQARAALLFGRPTHPYTAAWLDSARRPSLDVLQEPPTAAGSGCVFAKHCALQMPVCTAERPLLMRSPPTQCLRACHASPDAVRRRQAALLALR
ncbi:MAG TPA: ATP-binding cassette domain-containing protein [Paraburkholderia sp.]